MIANKNFTKIIAVIMTLAVIVTFGAIYYQTQNSGTEELSGMEMDYETALFNTDEIMSVNIIIDDDQWENMLANAEAEEYYKCDVEINGKTFHNVGIRPKGNTSLAQISSDPNTDRFSFKIEFDKYIEGQTCFGLDKLVLNNNYADATNMKDALIFDMYQYLGADASLYNYAKISVNDEYWGVYIALEAVEESFLLRNYGLDDGQLYKPETMSMGEDMDISSFESFDFSDMDIDFESLGISVNENGIPDFTAFADIDFSQLDMSALSSDFSLTSGGSDLNYIDDRLDSYQTIWDGAVTKTNKSDHQRVVTALKNISEKRNLEKYMDIDNILRYMAVHVFSVNDDSLTGIMAHNYYLYEQNGRLNILPWDYNLSLGGMLGGGDANSIINDPIDDAFNSTEFFDGLLENEEYRERYHEYLRQLVDGYINGGGFDEFYERTRSQIDDLAASDPTAFYTVEEYHTAADMLYDVVKLRGESIDGQLAGEIPDQRTIDASSYDLSIMGTMDMTSMMSNIDFSALMSSTMESMFSMIRNLIVWAVCLVGMIIIMILLRRFPRKYTKQKKK